MTASQIFSLQSLKRLVMYASLTAGIISVLIAVGSLFAERSALYARLESHELRLNVLETSQSMNSTLLREIRYNLKRYFVDQKLTYIELE
jgi:hypothetical protein